MKKKYCDLNKEQKIIKAKDAAAKKIKNKYKVITLRQDTNKLLQNKERYVRNVMEKLDSPSLSDELLRRRQAESLVSTAIYVRGTYITRLKKVLQACKDQVEISLSRLGIMSIHGNEDAALTALCGNPKHSCTSELYFSEAAYDFQDGLCTESKGESTVIILDENGKSTNIFPLLDSTKNQKNWQCNNYCKVVDTDILKDLKQLFEDLVYFTYVDANNYLKQIDICSAETGDPNKLGHPRICYAQPLLCSSKFLKLTVLSYHYPHLRTIKRKIYKVKQFYIHIQRIEDALNKSNVEELKNILSEADRLAMPFRNNNTEICLDEKEIKDKYSRGIKEYTKIAMDPPKIPCVSCERLCCSRKMVPVSNYKKSYLELMKDLLDVSVELPDYWKQLKDYYKDYEEFNCGFMCQFCMNKFKNNSLPSTCILNSLYVKDTPEEISTLNMYERILIQRAKAFQTVVKMGTVMKKNLPNYVKIDKVKGRTFHLPLPLEETLEKICPDTDPLNTNHEIFVLIRSNPSKGKIIWEDYVDIKKIWRALHWLKCWNPLYAEIIIPSPEQILNTLQDLELQYQDNSKDTDKIDNKDDNEEENENEATNLPLAALLTQKYQSDSFYEQYSIYPLHDKKMNNTDTKLYQMLKIYATALDVRGKDLDLKCFPDLYPFGMCGQHEQRRVRLREYDFIRSRLISKHSQFRLNIQYVFYLLHNNNIRQISAGIFHKLNVVNPRQKYTAGELLQELEKNQLESNMETIFARLRGTDAYWKRPRSDLDCMMKEYGPATFLLLSVLVNGCGRLYVSIFVMSITGKMTHDL